MASISDMMKEQAPQIKKLALCVPMRGKIDSIFMQSYLALFIHLLKKKGIVAQPIFSDAMPLDKARNQLAKSAILNRSDYILFMDSDIVMNEHMFEKLWETLHTPEPDGSERQIVTGIYYEREIPYDAVIRKRNELGLYEKIMQFPEDTPFVVDGMGFGFVLMRMKPLMAAFNATKGYPFRWTDKVSEDLYFCDLMAGAPLANLKILDKDGNHLKFKIWCDPRVQVPHYGSYTTQWHYLHYKLDEYSDIQELRRYLKEDAETTYQKCMHGALNMCRAWQERFGKDRDEATIPEEEILDFYRTTDLYLYDLTWFWSHSRQAREQILNVMFNRQAVISNKKGKGMRVLDFGCGIGDYGLTYAETCPEARVDFYDINSPNLKYLAHRIKKREADETFPKGVCSILSDSDMDNVTEDEEKYDIIICVDVLEHIRHPEKVAEKLRRLLKRNGVLVGKVAPKGDFQPQHISELDLNQCGFLQTDLFTYHRIDSDIAKNYAKVVDNLKSGFYSSDLKEVSKT